jgi:hypothetical protein
MGLPTLENGPYIFNVNNAFSEGSTANISKRMILELKNGLVALGGTDTIWHVVASSNSVAVVNILDPDEEHDLWNTISNVVYSTGAHSWCVLANKTTGAQMLIDYNTNAHYYVDIKYSTGGTYASDGTTTSAPTATDAGTLQVNSQAFTVDNSSYLTAVLNIMTSADHKTTRFYFHRKSSADANAGGWIGLIEEVANAPAAWTSTNKTMKLYLNTAFAASTTPSSKSPRLSDLDGNIWYVRFETDEPYSGWLACYPTSESYGDLNGGTATPIMHLDVDLDLVGGYPVCPIGLYRESGSYSGPMGRLRDIYWAPNAHDSLDTYPSGGSKQWIKWGCFFVPWNGSVPLATP